MENNFDSLKRTTEVFVNNLNEFAQTLGNPKLIGLCEDSKTIISNAEDFRKGIFKILIMGAFKTGKSTLLNSIIGTKLVATRAISCTAIITLIVFGEEDDKVEIYYKDKAPETITKSEYLSRYKLDIADEEEIETTGMASRFKDIEFAIVKSNYNLFRSGVRFIDSPGLEDKLSLNETTSNFVPKSNAIIYVLNALQLFTKHDKELISKNFKDKNNLNVFFVVNNFNRLNDDDDRQDVVDKTKAYLERCFCKEDGSPDEDLFNKRVFFVNALKAFDSKVKTENELLNKYSTSDRNQLYKDSEVKRLEDEIQNFVTTDSRLKTAIMTNIRVLSERYFKAIDKVNYDLKALQLPLEELKERGSQAEKILLNAKKEFKRIDSSFEIFKTSCFLNLAKSFDDRIRALERDWDGLTEDIENKLSSFDLVKMATSTMLNVFDKEKQLEKVQAIIKPFMDDIKEIVKNYFDSWANNEVPIIIENDRSKLEKDIKFQLSNVNYQIGVAEDIFSGGTGNIDYNDFSKVNYIQLATSAILGDPSLVIENMGAGGMRWGAFFKKSIVQMLVVYIISGIFTGGIAIVALIVWEIINIRKGSSDLNQKILDKIKETLFVELRKINIQENIEEKIWGSIHEERDKILNSVSAQIDEIINNQKQILQEHRNAETTMEEKKEKFNQSIASLKRNISNIYKNTFGKEPDIQTLKEIANRK